ncbi:MAG TPA: hypothetical protein VG795_00365, partial [Acidimicrobiia bacterium]|nr:hypothetical protein [Acidimicrobiia bacterium]
WGGLYTETLPLIAAEAREAEALGRLARAARAWANASYYHVAVGQLTEARRTLERAEALAARLGTPIPTAIYSQHLLCATLNEGWEPVHATFSFLATADNPALAWALGFAQAGRCESAAHLGRPEEALDAIRMLVPWLERAPVWTITYPGMAYAAADALWVLQRVDHIDVVEWALREKVLPANFRCMHDGHLALARVCALTGRHEEAERWFAESRRVLDEEGSRPLRALCDFDEALMYARRGDAGDAARARPLLAAGRRQFEDIGMTGWVRRADELEKQLS